MSSGGLNAITFKSKNKMSEESKNSKKQQNGNDFIAEVSISLERAKKYARHQHFLGSQGIDFVEFEDWAAKD